jgi:hypothetical protein
MKRNRFLQSSVCLFALAMLLGCGGGSGASSSSSSSSVVARGSRVLAIDALNGSNLPASLQAAQSAGGQSVTQLVTWTMIETSPGVYNTLVLQPAGSLVPQQGMSVSLMIAIINTTVKDVPPDLASLAFDDPVMIARFEALLDQIFAALPGTQLVSLGIGNEVEAYLNSDTLWTQYKNFYNAVAAYARAKRPGLKVGVQGTLYGVVGTWKSQYSALTQGSDLYMVSYYPLNADATVKDPSVVAADIDALVAAYPGKPIEIREAGYPTSSLLNSSNDKEATFVSNMFTAWDKYAAQIEFICFTRLNDKTAAEIAADASYYHITDANLLAFFQTLGLRTADGLEKPAFGTLRNAAKARGW